jgi:hypothetical protein
MSAISAGAAGTSRAGEQTGMRRLRDYFWSDSVRRIQTVLGLIWLLDGGLQFQGFMYSHAFPALLAGSAAGQPSWVHGSVIWGAKLLNGDLPVWNTLSALTQVGIGFGILYGPTVKYALVASFVWSLIVWWFGEAFGMIFMQMAQPLTGAPGAVLIYVLIGLVVWPNGKPGGLLGIRGTKIMWASLWLVLAYLWLIAPSATADGTSSVLNATSAGIGPIDSLQNSLASATKGDGVAIALVLAAVSAAIGIGVAAGWRVRLLLALAIVLNLIYWVIPQGFGGIPAGGATDPNSGLLFMVLAAALMPLLGASPGSVRNSGVS